MCGTDMVVQSLTYTLRYCDSLLTALNFTITYSPEQFMMLYMASLTIKSQGQTIPFLCYHVCSRRYNVKYTISYGRKQNGCPLSGNFVKVPYLKNVVQCPLYNCTTFHAFIKGQQLFHTSPGKLKFCLKTSLNSP